MESKWGFGASIVIVYAAGMMAASTQSIAALAGAAGPASLVTIAVRQWRHSIVANALVVLCGSICGALLARSLVYLTVKDQPRLILVGTFSSLGIVLFSRAWKKAST